MPDPSSSLFNSLSVRERIDILLEEYRVLYSLAEFRMGALDRRLPVTTGAFAAFLGSTTLLDPPLQLGLLVVLPLALIWLVRATINHARSFEDAIRRIDQIERKVNSLAGGELLTFQSQHPSRQALRGGRTGHETVLAVMTSSLLMLGGCVFLLVRHDPDRLTLAAYGFYILAATLTLGSLYLGLRRYRYRRQG